MNKDNSVFVNVVSGAVVVILLLPVAAFIVGASYKWILKPLMGW
jgi:hypothetical protein